MSDIENKNTEVIRVTMFPSLTVSDGTLTMTEQEIRSDMVVKLFSYLVFNHKKNCSAQELTSVLWADDESANPSGALKNLAYRLRTILKRMWPAKDFILTGKSSYRWNPEVPLSIDVEEFVSEIRRGEHSEEINTRIRHFSRAFALYKGKFLREFETEAWVMPKSAQYESSYLALARELSELLEKAGRYEEMTQVAQAALEIQPYDEKLHTALIRALLAQNRQDEAEDHYRLTEKLLYDNLGIGLSDELKNLFSAVMEREHSMETDLAVIQKELHEAAHAKGAYRCEYGVFKKIYELEARRVARMGMTIYLSLLTLYMNNSPNNTEGENREVMELAMVQMLDVALESLRAGDVLTRYSPNQYLIMLPACPYENAKTVMERIISNFEKFRRRVRVQVQYSLKEMETTPEGSHGNPLYSPSALRILVDSLDPVKKVLKGTIVGVALAGRYSFGGTSEFMHLVEELLNRIGKPQPGRLSRSFAHDEKYVSYKASPEIVRTVEDVEQEHGLLATYDAEFRSRSYSTWQGLLYGEGYKGTAFASELELVNLICKAGEEARR